MGSWLKIDFEKNNVHFSKNQIKNLQGSTWKIPSQDDSRDMEVSYRHSGIGVPSS